MSKTLLSGGLIAGALAGVVVALLQLWLIQPLIIEAERYETGELALPLVQTEDQPGMSTTIQPDDMQIEGTHLSRAGLTVIFLTLTWCGFGLLAGASMSAAQMSTNVRPFCRVAVKYETRRVGRHFLPLIVRFCCQWGGPLSGAFHDPINGD